MLVYGPCKFVVQFSGNKAHCKGAYGDDDGDGDQEGLDGRPNGLVHGIRKARIAAVQCTEKIDSLIDFRQLHGGVDDETKIVDA